VKRRGAPLPTPPSSLPAPPNGFRPNTRLKGPESTPTAPPVRNRSRQPGLPRIPSDYDESRNDVGSARLPRHEPGIIGLVERVGGVLIQMIGCRYGACINS
jgi:hypothetical protein